MKYEIQNTPQLRFPGFEGNWETNKLSDWKLKVIDGDRGTNYPNGDDFSQEGYCLFMNAKNVTKNGFSFETKMFITKEKDENLRKGKLKRNDLILTTRGSVGNIAFYDDSIKFENLRINSGMVIIRNENSKIDSRFIYSSFFTPKLNRIIDTISFGSAQPQLTVKEINLFKFNIPTLPEQQKIASFLSAVDEKIQQLSRKKELLAQYKKGVMQQLFSGKLRFKDENGKDYADWEEKKLGDIGKIRMCKRVFSDETSETGEIPFYKIGTFGKEADAFITKELYNYYKERFSFPKTGEILLSASGTLGRTVIYDGSPSYFQDSNIVWIENNEENTTNLFLWYIYQIVRYDSEGGTIQRLYNSIISNTKFKNPALPEQQKIASFLSSIDTKIESTNQQINQTQSFKKGLLQQLFV